MLNFRNMIWNAWLCAKKQCQYSEKMHCQSQPQLHPITQGMQMRCSLTDYRGAGVLCGIAYLMLLAHELSQYTLCESTLVSQQKCVDVSSRKFCCSWCIESMYDVKMSHDTSGAVTKKASLIVVTWRREICSHCLLAAGHLKPSLARRIVLGIGVPVFIPNCVPVMSTFAWIWVKSAAVSIAVFRSVFGYPVMVVPFFPTRIGKSSASTTWAPSTLTKISLCWNPINTFHDFSSSVPEFKTITCNQGKKRLKKSSFAFSIESADSFRLSKRPASLQSKIEMKRRLEEAVSSQSFIRTTNDPNLILTGEKFLTIRIIKNTFRQMR